MIYHDFTDHHLKLSEICFGGASISGSRGGYGFGAISFADSIELVLEAYDKGINFFDTAPIYGFNESERVLSQSLKKIREKVTIISKCGVDWHDSKRVNMSNDPKVCQKMLDQSLKFHQYLDVYMIHWPDKNIDIRYPLEVLQKAKEKKDILHIGLCNTNQEDLDKAEEVCTVDIVQSEVNLFHNQLRELKTPAYKMGWGTFDKGILTGSVTEDRHFDKDDCRSWAPWWKKSNWKDKVKKVKTLKEFVNSHHISLLELALSYSLSEDGVHSAICGFKNSKQLDGILYANQNKVADDLILEGKRILE